MIIEIDDNTIVVKEDVIRLSTMLSALAEDEEYRIRFDTNMFSYITYKETISLCEKYLRNEKIIDIQDIFDKRIPSCLNYLCISEVLHFVCKRLALQKFDIGLESFVIKHIKKNWSLYHLLSNRNIFIKNPPVSKNFQIEDYYNFRMKFIIKRLVNKETSKHFIREYTNTDFNSYIDTTERKINDYDGKDDTGFRKFATNPNITEEFVKKHKHMKWTYDNLSENPNISIEFMDTFLIDKSDICYILLSPNVTIEFIKKNIEKFSDNVSRYRISSNSSITLTDVKNNPQLQWNYRALSQNTNITMEFIKEHKDKEWDIIDLLKNIAIKLDDMPHIVTMFCNKNNNAYGWHSVFENPNITIDSVKKFLDRYKMSTWVFSGFMQNTAITMKDVQDNPDLFLNYNELSKNKNITFDFIEKNLDKYLDWTSLSQNSFFYERKMICKKKYEDLGLEDDIINIILSYVPED